MYLTWTYLVVKLHPILFQRTRHHKKTNKHRSSTGILFFGYPRRLCVSTFLDSKRTKVVQLSFVFAFFLLFFFQVVVLPCSPR